MDSTPNPLMPQSPISQQEPQSSWGPVVASIIIILILLVGGFYFWQQSAQNNQVAPVTDTTQTQETTTASPASSTPEVSKSDDLNSIDADLKATSVDTVDTKTIDNSFNQ